MSSKGALALVFSFVILAAGFGAELLASNYQSYDLKAFGPEKKMPVPEPHDRLLETTETMGTGAYTLLGPPGPEWCNFRAAMADGDQVYYAVQQVGAGYEFGIGTLSYGTGPSGADVLSRTSVIGSSQSNSIMFWGGGKKTIFAVWPASRLKLQATLLEVSGGGPYSDLSVHDIEWTSEVYDSSNSWTSGEEVAVPSFAKKARVTLNLNAGGGAGNFLVYNRDNGAMKGVFTAPLDASNNVNVSSAWMMVEPGDRLVIQVAPSSDITDVNGTAGFEFTN